MTVFGDGSWALHGSLQNFQDPSPNIVYAIHGNMTLKEYKLGFVHSENGNLYTAVQFLKIIISHSKLVG